jgi:cell filamentation protein
LEAPWIVFASRSAYYLGEINAIHPFSEGNGRMQREFIRELGRQSTEN